MKRTIATLALAGGLTLGFAGTAHAGTLTYYRECGPDGTTIVYLTAIDGGTTPYIDGIQTSMLVTGPGVHTAEWYGPATNADGTTDPTRIVLWGSKTITVEPSNCAQPTTTTTPPTTTQAPPTSAEATTSTTAAVAPAPSTIPPQIDMDVDPCVTSATGCAPVPTPAAEFTGSTLPATGPFDHANELLGAGALTLAAGVLLLLGKRIRRVTS